MSFYPVVCYDSTHKVHRPMVEGEELINPLLIPASPRLGNKLLILPDGLYLGSHPCPATFMVDTVSGIDSIDELNPPITATVQTLAFALRMIETYQPSDCTILLRVGQQHDILATRYIRNCELNIGFYADPKYGTYGDYYGDSKVVGQRHIDVTRPIITSAPTLDADTGCWYMPAIRLLNSQLRSYGVKFLIPSPSISGLQAPAYSVESDIIRSRNSSVYIDGCIVDKPDAESCFGFMGVEDRSHSILREQASQFLIGSAQLNSAAFGSIALANRAYFIKMLPGQPSGNTKDERYSMVATSLGSVPSAALLDIHWSLSQLVSDPKTASDTLATFPTTSSSFGLGNYIFGIVKDSQHRAVNVNCNFPL